MGILIGNICVPRLRGWAGAYIRYKQILNLVAKICVFLVALRFNLNLCAEIRVDRNVNLITNIEDIIGVFCNGVSYYVVNEISD